MQIWALQFNFYTVSAVELLLLVTDEFPNS